MSDPTRHDDGQHGRNGARRAAVALAGVSAVLASLALTACGADSPASNGAATGTTTTPLTSPTETSPDAPASEPTPAAQTKPTYLFDGVVHRADGSTFRPRLDGQVAAFTDLADGRWVFTTETDRSGAQLVLTSPSGATLTTYPLAYTTALTVNPDRTALAWLDPQLKPQVLTNGASDPTSLPTIGGGQASGLTSDNLGGLVIVGDCADDCSVLVAIQRSNGSSEIWRSSSTETKASRWTTKLLDVTDVSPDGKYVTGSTKRQLDPTGLCAAMVEVSTGNRAWETCKTSTLRFSPDGSHLLGIDPYLDGAYHAQLFVLAAANGKIQSRVQRSTNDETWLNDDSYVSAELGPKGWRLVQHQLDGTAKPLTKPAYDKVSGDETSSPYRLALR